jgi:hypothetical protein
MSKQTYGVAIYEDHDWVTTPVFKQKWQALLFHWLLHKSLDHLGAQGR